MPITSDAVPLVSKHIIKGRLKKYVKQGGPQFWVGIYKKKTYMWKRITENIIIIVILNIASMVGIWNLLIIIA